MMEGEERRRKQEEWYINWHESMCDKNKYILVNANNKVISHHLSYEESSEHSKLYPIYNHIRIYKEVESVYD